ncbi:MAG: hypothetical protein L3J41_16730 [Melioribacteraceae bacterium]|nr:hypothetical protein [Melioribacteraceae bacterium]
MNRIHLFILIPFFLFLEHYNAQTKEPIVVNKNRLHTSYKQNRTDIFQIQVKDLLQLGMITGLGMFKNLHNALMKIATKLVKNLKLKIIS